MARRVCTIGAIVCILLAWPIVGLAQTADSPDRQLIEQIETLKSQWIDTLREDADSSATVKLKKEVVELSKKAYGPTDSRVAKELIWLAREYSIDTAVPVQQERVELLSEAIAILDAHGGGEDVEDALSSLGDAFTKLRKWAQGISAYSRFAGMVLQSKGEDSDEYISALQSLGFAYHKSGTEGADLDDGTSLDRAETTFETAIAILEKRTDPDNSTLNRLYSFLADLLEKQGKDAAAVSVYRRAIAIETKTLRQEREKDGVEDFEMYHFYNGPNNHIAFGTYLRTHSQTADADKIFQQGLRLMVDLTSEQSITTLYIRSHLSQHYALSGRDSPAMAEAKRVMDIAGSDPDIDQGAAFLLLGMVHDAAGRYKDAAGAFHRGLEIVESRDIAADRLPAFVEFAQNGARSFARIDDAKSREAVFRKAAQYIGEQNESGTTQHASILAELASALAEQGRSDEAVAEILLAGSIARDRYAAVLKAFGRRDLALETSETAVINRVLDLLWSIPKSTSERQKASELALQIAQTSHGTRAAKALSQMMARIAAQSEQDRENLLALQTLEATRDDLNGQLLSLRSAADDTHREKIAALSAKVRETDSALSTLTERLGGAALAYYKLASPEPEDATSIAGELTPHEAFVQLVVREQDTLVWVVTKTESAWYRAELGNKAIADDVAALRCGLDSSAWRGRGESKCQKLLAIGFKRDDIKAEKALPFDAVRAHRLYAALLGPAEAILQASDGAPRKLLIVPSGALAQLPFQVLITRPATTDDKPAWLIARHAIAVLPSAASLKALRAHAGQSQADRPMLAFANPSVDGSPDSDEDRALRVEARALTDCQRVAEHSDLVKLRQAYDLWAAEPKTQQTKLGPTETADSVRRFKPVPRTADLVCGVAEKGGAGENLVLLAADASESRLRALNAANELRHYSTIHFATHGVLAGEVLGQAEPGLVLSPPDAQKATDVDDGYLSASEIAGLKLDADWAILSACNTAGGGADNSEVLSGLARAFFFAGSRALLVSHWSVYVDAAVELVSNAILNANRGSGRAEALQKAMVDLIEHGSAREAHPSFWAPFVLVGEN